MDAHEMPKEVTFFKEWIPNRIRVILCVLFAACFQFSGGIYLSSVTEMAGDLALMHEDIMMVGYASFVGMTMVFPVLFRLKFRFTARSILLTVCPVLILCNYVTMSTDSMPVLVVASFVAGVFRMWGTFECLSNMQLSLTPERDFTVFFPFIYTIILGSIEVSGILAADLSWWADWRYMHLFIMGLLLAVWLLAFMLTRPFRLAPPVPLEGIDWAGCFLWSVFLLSGIFVCEYGRFFDWFSSPYIRSGSALCAVTLAAGICRMFRREDAFIEAGAFRYRNLAAMLAVFMVVCMLQATPEFLQSIYTGSILGFERQSLTVLNWWGAAGVLAGCLMSYLWMNRLHGGFRVPVFFGFAVTVLYQAAMYFLIDPGMNVEKLYFPTFLRNAGHAVIYCVVTVYASRVVPFRHFFQVLSIMGFVRTGMGSPLAAAIYGRILDVLLPANLQRLTVELDSVNPAVSSIPAVYGQAMEQAMLVSIKDIFGWTTIAGIILLACVIVYRRRWSLSGVRKTGRLAGQAA